MPTKYITLNPHNDFWDAMGKEHCCVAMRVEDDVIHCVSGTGVKYCFFKDDFKSNAIYAPDFTRPSITDHGMTLVFGEYQAEFTPESGRVVEFDTKD